MLEVSPYNKLAYIYDRLMDHVDYRYWSEYIFTLIKTSGVKIDSLIDLSCGTGSLLIQFLGKVDTLYGCDSSIEMIKHARKKAELSRSPLFLNDVYEIAVQDTTFDCALFLYDSLNYITEDQSLIHSLGEIYRILKKGGIFIFDVVSDLHCREHYSDFHENEYWGDDGYSRHSFYDQEAGYQYNEFRIVLKGKTYIEKHEQKVYSIEFLEDILEKRLFKVIGMFDDFSTKSANTNSGRIHLVCIKS